MAQLTQQLLRLMCTNTAWQQRKLGRVILDWGSLLHEVAYFSELWLNLRSRHLKQFDLFLTLPLVVSWSVHSFLIVKLTKVQNQNVQAIKCY